MLYRRGPRHDVGTGLRWNTAPTIAVSVILAFLFGYAFTVAPLYRSGLPLASVVRLALAADTFSIIIMEIVDNGIMLVIPGAMDAGLGQPLFWISLAGSLLLAGRQHSRSTAGLSAAAVAMRSSMGCMRRRPVIPTITRTITEQPEAHHRTKKGWFDCLQEN